MSVDALLVELPVKLVAGGRRFDSCSQASTLSGVDFIR